MIKKLAAVTGIIAVLYAAAPQEPHSFSVTLPSAEAAKRFVTEIADAVCEFAGEFSVESESELT